MKIKSYDFKKKPTALLIAILSLIIFLPAAYYLTIHPFTARAAWFDDRWSYRNAVPISSHTSAESNVYVAVTIDTSASGQFQADCGDLRWTNQGGEPLKYYVVSGCGIGTTVVHVLFLNSFPAWAQTLYYYYGNSTVANGFSANDFSTEASAYVIGTVAAQEKSPAPVAYWKFDEGYGSTTSDGSQNSNTGTLGGATLPTWQTEDACIAGKCLYFDGASSKVTASVVIPAMQTISFWVRPNTIASQGLLDFDGGTHKIVTDASGVISATGFTSPTYYLNGAATATPTLVLNQWNFVTISTGTGFDTTSSWTAGTDGTNFIKGFMDDVKIYNYARTLAQVKTDYNAGKAHAATAKGTSQSFSSAANNDALSNGLTGYWKMNEASSDAADSSGNGYTLTNNAVATFVAGKFGNAGNLVAASSQFFSTATNLGSVNTISFWVYPTSTTTNILDLDGTKTITAASGTISANSFTSPIIYVNGVVSSTLTANIWQHVTVTTTSAITTNSFKIGKVGSDYFDGKIDEARIYNRALQPSEVATLYNFAPGPVGYWKLDENTGTAANDTSGAGLTGTWNGTGSHWTNGKYGSGGNFNGTSDYITMGDVLSFERTDSFSASFWLKSSQTSDANFVSKQQNSGDFIGWGIGRGVSKLEFFLYNSPQGIIVDAPSAYADSTWHHIAFTYNGSSLASGVTLYVDGSPVAKTVRQDDLASTIVSSASFQIIGRATTGNLSSGQIDDVRIYNYARTAGQVIEDMNAGHPIGGSPISSQVGFWKFDEGYGASAFNSGNGGSLTGTLTPGAGGSHTNAVQLWDRMGKFNRSVNLDGTDDLVTVSDNAALDMSSSFSLTTWVNFHSTSPSAQSLIEKGEAAGTANYYFWWNRNAISPSNAIVCGFHDGVAFRDHTYVWTPTVNKWYQLSCVFDDTTNLLKIYIDGVQVLSEAETNTPLADAGSLNFGANRNSSNNLSGKLDDIKIYNSALTAEQIKLDFNRGFTQVLGSLSTSSDGITASNSAERSYCVPGDTSTCSAPSGEWLFNENTGTGANDSSGNGNTGTLTATPTWNVGKVGSALSFNGSTQFVSLPAAARPGAANTFTVSAWVRKKANGSYMGIYGNNNGTGASGFNFMYNPSNQLECTKISIVGGQLVSTTTITDQNWHYVSCVISSSGMFVYLDGKLDNSNSNTDNISDFNGVIYIGAINEGSNGNQKFFNGLVDQVRTFNYARSAAQVAWDFNQGKPLAWWKFDECQGATMNDSSGNSLSGTWNGTGGGTQTAVGTCLTSGTAWFNGATGKFNSSLNFDGTDDYVNLGDPAKLDFSSTDSFSISTWAKTSTSSELYIFGKYKCCSAPKTVILFGVKYSGKFNVELRGNTYSNLFEITSNRFINDDAWHLLTLTYDNPNDLVSLYVDGVFDKSTAWTGDGAMSTDTPVTIGATWNDFVSAYAGFFPGQIDDMRIFNYPLTATQIKSLYNNGGTVRYGPATGSP